MNRVEALSVGSLVKVYGLSIAAFLSLFFAVAAIFAPETLWVSQEWAVLGLVFSYYLLLSLIQFLVLLLIELTLHGKLLLLCETIYVFLAYIVNIMMYGFVNGLRSIIMFVIVTAVIFIIIRSASRRRNPRGSLPS